MKKILLTLFFILTVFYSYSQNREWICDTLLVVQNDSMSVSPVNVIVKLIREKEKKYIFFKNLTLDELISLEILKEIDIVNVSNEKLKVFNFITKDATENGVISFLMNDDDSLHSIGLTTTNLIIFKIKK